MQELDLIANDNEAIAVCLDRYVSYEAIQIGSAVEIIAMDYQNISRQREIVRHLPEVWNNLVSSASENSEYLIEAVRSEAQRLCGNRPTNEQIFTFLKNLGSHTDIPPLTPKPRPNNGSTRSEKYQAYFQALLDEMREQHNFTKARRPGKGANNNYYNFASGFTSIGYVAGFNNVGTVYTQLWIHFRDYETTKNFFDVLKERESEINARFDVPVYWDRRDDIKTSLIYIQRDGNIETHASELEAFRAWHVENLLKFKEVFTPEIQLALEKLKTRR